METSIDDNTLTKDQNDSSVSAQAQPETGQTESGNDSKTNTTKEVNFINEPGFKRSFVFGSRYYRDSITIKYHDSDSSIIAQL